MYKNERNRKREEEYTHNKEVHSGGDDGVVGGRGVCWWLAGEVLEEVGESQSSPEWCPAGPWE